METTTRPQRSGRRRPDDDGELVARAEATASRLRQAIGEVVRGKEEAIHLLVVALACRGHVFLQDVPGTAKTVLARALAGAVEGASTARIQCTPDLLPSDVTGVTIWDQRRREFVFRAGPVFSNVLLVDEINRAMPKTQSALLEAMAERQVTIDGKTLALPDPFLLIATANPIEHEGTFPLPEAQLDRFFLRTTLGYPSPDDELQVIDDQLHGHPLARMRAVVSMAEAVALSDAIERVFIRTRLKRWIVDLVQATRSHPEIELGASVRGTLALERAARANALMRGRSYVVPEDVLELFVPVIAHRLLLYPSLEARLRNGPPELLLEELLRAAPRPEPQQWSPTS
jgi:MoxR-like ATPase